VIRIAVDQRDLDRVGADAERGALAGRTNRAP